MLTAIQDMKYLLRTVYSNSTNFVAAPAGWAVIIISILQAHKRKGHGANFRCPISRREGKLANILFVDNTDLIHLDLEATQYFHETHGAIKGVCLSGESY